MILYPRLFIRENGILKGMKNSILRLTKLAALSGTAAALITTGSLGLSALAAPPYAVTQAGTPVTVAVPGKSLTMKFQVKNTGTTVYSDVKVVFHIPNGLTTTAVSPANSEIVDDTVTWINVPIAAGKTFNPVITFAMDSGVKLGTKLNVWVEVTGKDMEANSKNFSVVATKAVKASTLTSAQVSSLFQIVYGRMPTGTELSYWMGRRTDKPGSTELSGAMGYHQAKGISH